MYPYIRLGPRDRCESVDLTICVTGGGAGVDSAWLHRAAGTCGSRKNAKPRFAKCSKIPYVANGSPQRPMHAVLSRFCKAVLNLILSSVTAYTGEETIYFLKSNFVWKSMTIRESNSPKSVMDALIFSISSLLKSHLMESTRSNSHFRYLCL